MPYDYIAVQPNDWIDAFARFQSFVNRGVYNKIDYRIWKQLSKLDPFKTNLLIGWHYNQASSRFDITVMTEDIELIFNSKDGSFGEYLNIWVLSTIDKNTCSEAPKTFNIITNTDNTEKENNTMNFNFDFGPVNPSLVRMSMYGLAVKNKSGTWVSYNSNSDEIMDVDVLNFDGAKFLYRAPVAIKDIVVGDVVIHNGAPMFVVAIPDGGKVLTVIDTINGERKDIMLAKSPFGFNFATKVVNFLGNMFNTSATTENPFGNMWMLMAMSGDNKDMDDMLPFLMMNNAASGMDNNMLMCLLLCKNKGNSDMLPWLLMSQSMNAVPTHVCKCGGNCGESRTQN
jgi:hypothetical protein